MVFLKILERLLILFIWAFIFSIIGFSITVANLPDVPWTINNYLLFLNAGFTNEFFYLYGIHTGVILKLFIPTIELVVVSSALALFITYVLVIFTIKRPVWSYRLFLFFSIMRGIPFIALPLIFSQGITDNFGQALQLLDDDRSFTFKYVSRLYVILAEQTDQQPIVLLIKFLGLCLTVSYVLLPIIYVLCSRVVYQVVKQPYVQNIMQKWSAFNIVNKMVVHRVIPVFLKEFIYTFAKLFTLVCCLEYIFQWKGIGAMLINIVQAKSVYAADLGFTIFLMGTFFCLVHALLNILGTLYDPNGIKELPYELD